MRTDKKKPLSWLLGYTRVERLTAIIGLLFMLGLAIFVLGSIWFK